MRVGGGVADGTALAGHGGAVRGLAERWLARVPGDAGVRGAGGDFAVSPAGLWLALAAVAAGAGGRTAEELRGLLGVAGEEAAAAATGAARELRRTEALATATGVWARVPVYRAFREALPGIGFGRLGGGTAAELDAWAAEATGGLIGRLPVEVSGDALLLLVNAMLLTARWAEPFEGWRTAARPFTDAAGVRHEVPTMHRSVPPADAWRVAGVSVVELRCAAGDGALPAVVRLVLGPEGAAPGAVLPAAWSGPGPGERAGFGAEAVRVALPRLSLRTRLDVLPQLRALGVREALAGAADFSLLSPEPLRVSQVAQECVLRLAERGVEAAAATAVMMVPGSARPPRAHEVRFDRPFGVVVLDGGGTVPLVTAWQASAPPPGSPPAPGLPSRAGGVSGWRRRRGRQRGGAGRG